MPYSPDAAERAALAGGTGRTMEVRTGCSEVRLCPVAAPGNSGKDDESDVALKATYFV